MGHWALQFTPSVTLEAQRDVVLLEVSASLRLWGGEKALLQRLQQGWTALGWQPPDVITMACGPTPRAAQWQASYAAMLPCPAEIYPGIELHRLPVHVIEELGSHLSMLKRMGVHTIGQLEGLPRAGLSQRFGPSLVYALDAAAGRQPDPRRWITSPEQFHRQIELPLRADHKDLIEQATSRLITELSGWLSARQASVRSFMVTLIHDTPPDTPLRLGLAGPTREVQRLRRLLSERLVRCVLKRPVYEVALTATQIEPLPESSADLLGGPSVIRKDSWAELIERLAARLGPEQVQEVMAVDDHRPESAGHAIPLLPGLAQSGSSWDRAARLRPKGKPSLGQAPLSVFSESHRPVWLFARPLALSTQSERPFYRGPLRLLSGPERIEAGWWEAQSDAVAQRDYFIARSRQETLLWVFRTPEHRWYLHGLFG